MTENEKQILEIKIHAAVKARDSEMQTIPLD